MNDKEKEVYQIIDIVIYCCAYHGKEQELRDSVLSGARDDNTVLTRCMLARMLAFAGYCNATIAILLNRSEKSIRNLLDAARDCRRTRHSYKKAEDQAIRMFYEKCGNIED